MTDDTPGDKHVMHEPDLVQKMTVPDSGRLFLGEDWANKDVKVALKDVSDDAE